MTREAATQKQINDQKEALKEATENALKSKESTLKYLEDAGIIEKKPDKLLKRNKEFKK
jgi:hypothetical protein